VQGEAVTKGLRRVTDNMKTKNRADRTGVVSASTGAPALSPATSVFSVPCHVRMGVSRFEGRY
jgi:adenylyl cyclase-associated protein